MSIGDTHTWARVSIFLISLFAGLGLIRTIGNKTTSGLNGYELGNRRRTVSVYCLLWAMMHGTYLIYLHIFSVFELNEDTYTSLTSTQNCISPSCRLRRRRALFVFWFVIVGAHLCYLFYVLNSPIPWLVFEISAICTGVWLHLIFFSILFLSFRFMVDCLKIFKIGQTFLSLACSCRLLQRIFTDPKVQVSITFWATILLSTVQYLSSDHIVVKEITFPLNKWPSSQEPMRLAVITDLHSGGSVYGRQIEKVVDLTNSLDVDAVLLIGDIIDAPRSWIEDRTRALKNLKSKYGSYMVTGNHEYYYGNWEDWRALFIQYGINVLENRATNVGPVPLCLVGLNDLSSSKSGIVNHSINFDPIANCSKNVPIVVLEHNPAAASQILKIALDRHVDLIFSGHTHAGQYYVAAPFVYLLLPYFHGVYPLDAGSTTLLVSSGTLYQAAPMKMPFSSEIWIVTLKSNA